MTTLPKRPKPAPAFNRRAEEYMSEELKTERLRTCPKCRSQNVRWYEIYKQPMYWDQFATGIDPEGCETQAGEIIAVRGKCRKCRRMFALSLARLTHRSNTGICARLRQDDA